MGISNSLKIFSLFLTLLSPKEFFNVPGYSTPIGIDGSTIIHALLRRHMAQILEQPAPNWQSFREDAKQTLRRIGGWGHPGSPVRLWLVFDGKRINSKLSNEQLASDETIQTAAISHQCVGFMGRR